MAQRLGQVDSTRKGPRGAHQSKSDGAAACFVLARDLSTTPLMAFRIRLQQEGEEEFDVRVHSEHIVWKDNLVPDSLSRGRDEDDFRILTQEGFTRISCLAFGTRRGI